VKKFSLIKCSFSLVNPMPESLTINSGYPSDLFKIISILPPSGVYSIAFLMIPFIILSIISSGMLMEIFFPISIFKIQFLCANRDLSCLICFARYLSSCKIIDLFSSGPKKFSIVSSTLLIISLFWVSPSIRTDNSSLQASTSLLSIWYAL